MSMVSATASAGFASRRPSVPAKSPPPPRTMLALPSAISSRVSREIPIRAASRRGYGHWTQEDSTGAAGGHDKP